MITLGGVNVLEVGEIVMKYQSLGYFKILPSPGKGENGPPQGGEHKGGFCLPAGGNRA